jgi:3-deoxy-D-manno-octulosonic-acid transferase
MRIAYSLLLYLLVPFALVRLLARAAHNPGYRSRIAERFGFIRPRATGAIWIHAVSVGEARGAAPLVRALMAADTARRVLITTMTPTGSATVRSLFGDAVDHCYVPWDLPGAVRRFLDRARPVAALIMETEIWPNLFHACAERDIPIAIANMRMSERSARRYARFPRFTRDTLSFPAILAAQTQEDAARLKDLGAPAERLHVTGSIKFDLSLPDDYARQAAALRDTLGAERPVWIAASTHAGEDEIVLDAHRAVRERFPEVLLLLAPRHPERFNSVARLASTRGFRTGLRTEQRTGAALPADTEVLVCDTMGELQLLYGAADVAFVGGSLVPTGGHNLLEPAAAAIPVVFGPHMFNFDEIARLTLAHGAGRQVAANSAGLTAAVRDYFDDCAARLDAGTRGKQMVEANRGALGRLLGLLAPILEDRGRPGRFSANIRAVD